MSRSRDYVGDLPAEIVERLLRKAKRKRAIPLEHFSKDFVELKNVPKPATPGGRAHPPGSRNGSAKRSTKRSEEKCPSI
jgi:hypothetical protein